MSNHRRAKRAFHSKAARRLIYSVMIAVLTAGCASSRPDPAEKAPLRHPEGAAAMTIDKPIQEADSAVLEALADLNAIRIVDQEDYVKAKCATGEIVRVYLEASAGTTRIWITSHRTYVGASWQNDRRNDLVWAINRVVQSRRSP